MAFNKSNEILRKVYSKSYFTALRLLLCKSTIDKVIIQRSTILTLFALHRIKIPEKASKISETFQPCIVSFTL